MTITRIARSTNVQRFSGSISADSTRTHPTTKCSELRAICQKPWVLPGNAVFNNTTMGITRMSRRCTSHGQRTRWQNVHNTPVDSRFLRSLGRRGRTMSTDTKSPRIIEPILLSKSEAAECLCVSERTLDTLPIRRVRIGKRVLFRRDDLQQFVESLPCEVAVSPAASSTYSDFDV